MNPYEVKPMLDFNCCIIKTTAVNTEVTYVLKQVYVVINCTAQ